MGLFKNTARLANSANDERAKAEKAKARGDMKAFRQHIKNRNALADERAAAQEHNAKVREAELKELDEKRFQELQRKRRNR